MRDWSILVDMTWLNDEGEMMRNIDEEKSQQDGFGSGDVHRVAGGSFLVLKSGNGGENGWFGVGHVWCNDYDFY